LLNCIIETIPVKECRVLASTGPGRGCPTFLWQIAIVILGWFAGRTWKT